MTADLRPPGQARWEAPDWVVWLAALIGPAVLTGLLVQISGAEKRNYVFLYLGLVAVVGVARGLWPALLTAVVSFAFLDYFFVEPYYTFTISRQQDVLNLVCARSHCRSGGRTVGAALVAGPDRRTEAF